MNEIVKIGNRDIPVIEWKGQRVITTSLLADVYEATDTQIKQKRIKQRCFFWNCVIRNV